MSLTGNYHTWERIEDVSAAIRHVFRGNAFFFRHRQSSIGAGSTYYYGFTTHPAKETAVYIRSLDAGEGPVALNIYPAGTWTGQSSTVRPFSLYSGFPDAGMEIDILATGVGGLTPFREIDYAFSTGNKTSTAGIAGLPTIFPPATSFLLGVVNGSIGVNPGVAISIAFAEIDVPSDV